MKKRLGFCINILVVWYILVIGIVILVVWYTFVVDFWLKNLNIYIIISVRYGILPVIKIVISTIPYTFSTV